ncbi:BH3-interacting domain death agonist isoform X2 [Rhinoderma darwinii]
MSAKLIFFAFLECQKCPDVEFDAELRSLVKSDGGDGDLQTDSYGFGPLCGSLETDSGPQSEIDEELCRRIGAQLAMFGDRFEQEGRIKSEVVESLVNDILNESLTEDRFEDAVKSLMDNLPPGMDLEKATLVVAMSLTSKVGSSVPNLLQSCFTTALSFIQRNYRSYIDRLARQE